MEEEIKTIKKIRQLVDSKRPKKRVVLLYPLADISYRIRRVEGRQHRFQSAPSSFPVRAASLSQA
jgi:hypothetical protein